MAFKYHDPGILNAIKQWVECADRKNVNTLTKEIGYSDFNKFGKRLLDVQKRDPKDRPKTIEDIAHELAKNTKLQISKQCFLYVANYVFDLNKEQSLTLKAYIPEHADVWQSLEELQILKADVKINLDVIRRQFVSRRKEMNRQNLESIMLAGLIVYLCSLLKDRFPQSENLTKSVCIPVLESLGLPASEASVSRYRTGFEAFIRAFSRSPVPEVPFSQAWAEWWSQLQAEIKTRCDRGIEAFKDYTDELQKLPRISILTLVTTANGDKDGDPSDEEKLQHRIASFNKLSPNAKNTATRRKLSKIYLDIQFLSQVELDEAAIGDLKAPLHKLKQIKQTLKSALEPAS